MERDRRLRGLSSEHHQALVLARRSKSAESWSAEEGAQLVTRFVSELEPHFRIEEDVLLPALERAGELALVERTRSEHRALRELVERAGRGELDATNELGRLLETHVRFEERELFPACEKLLSGRVLDEVARQRPKR